jgi:hypothetical protein
MRRDVLVEPQEVGNVYKLAHIFGSASYAAVCMGGDELAGELAASAASLTRDLDDTLTGMFVQGKLVSWLSSPET